MASCRHGKDKSRIETSCLLCLLEGELAAEAGQAQALDSAAGREWIAKAMPVALRLAASGRPFSSEQITARVGLPRASRKPGANNAVGALMGALSRQGYIRQVARTHATDPLSHATNVGVWEGTAKADEQW